MALSRFAQPKRKQQRPIASQRPRWWQLGRAKWLFHWGVVALHRGRYQRAAILLEEARQVLDNDPFVHLHLGWAHWFLGHPVTARRHLVRAAELAPNQPAPLVFAGRLLALRGKWQEAEQFLRRAIQLAPQNLVAQSWLAYILLQQGQTDEALRILKQFPVADDPYLQARLILHLERLLAQQEEPANDLPPPSLPWWCRLPFLGWWFRWRGERLLEDGRWAEAAKLFSKAVALRPKDIWAKLLWAISLIENGNFSQGERVLAEVPESLPEREWVYGALLVRQGQVREAARILSQHADQHPFVRYYLALALDWAGEAEYACVAFLEPLYREDPSYLRQRLSELLRRLLQTVPY